MMKNKLLVSSVFFIGTLLAAESFAGNYVLLTVANGTESGSKKKLEVVDVSTNAKQGFTSSPNDLRSGVTISPGKSKAMKYTSTQTYSDGSLNGTLQLKFEDDPGPVTIKIQENNPNMACLASKNHSFVVNSSEETTSSTKTTKITVAASDGC